MNYRKTLLMSAVAATLATFYGCAPDPMPFDPARMQRNNRQAAKELTPSPMTPIATQLETTYAPRQPGRLAVTQPVTRPSSLQSLDNVPTLRLSLREVIHRTVNNNMQIRVAGYEPAINSQRVTEAVSRFDPTFFVSPFWEQRDTQFNTSTANNTESLLNTWGASVGIRQATETGGEYELRHETNNYHNPRQPFTIPSSTTQPSLPETTDDYFSNNLVAEFKQPLLKNFGTDINRARITVARNDQKISLLDYRKQLEETLFNTERTYWELYQAQREVQITQELLRYTEETAELLSKRGTQDVTLVHTSQANSALQQRRAIQITAISRVKDLSDQLKALMNDPELPVSSSTLVLPATEPITTPIIFDPQDQINQALEHRLELAQQVLRIDSQSLITRVAKNNLLPALQLVTSATANGADPDWWPANETIADFRYMTYRVGLQFEVPLGNRQAQAIYQRTLLQRQQAIDQYRQLVEQASLEVSQALRSVETNWESRNANHQAVMATEMTLNAITTRERAEEALTPSFVQLKLDTQQRLAEARRNEAQAVANYAVAIAALERAKGTLLRYDNVIMEEDRLMAIQRGNVLGNVPPIKPPTAVTAEPSQTPPSR